jgi:predicted deacylase
MADVGDAQLDGVLRGALAEEAARMGGHGVIHVEFYDENPSTDLERASRAASSINNVLSGRGGVESKERYVTVKGEVIQFLE